MAFVKSCSLFYFIFFFVDGIFFPCAELKNCLLFSFWELVFIRTQMFSTLILLWIFVRFSFIPWATTSSWYILKQWVYSCRIGQQIIMLMSWHSDAYPQWYSHRLVQLQLIIMKKSFKLIFRSNVKRCHSFMKNLAVDFFLLALQTFQTLTIEVRRHVLVSHILVNHRKFSFWHACLHCNYNINEFNSVKIIS